MRNIYYFMRISFYGTGFGILQICGTITEIEKEGLMMVTNNKHNMSRRERIRRRKRQRFLFCTTLLSVVVVLLLVLVAILIKDFQSSNKENPPKVTQSQTQSQTQQVSQTETTAPLPEPLDEDLAKITDYIPDVVLDIRYATTNNFTKQVIYEEGFETKLRYGTLKKLMAAAEELRSLGYKLVIWDAYRPVEAQYKLWTVYPVSDYVANPITGNSKHSKGCTVDISMVKLDGTAVEMPSDFDDFSARADRDYSDVSQEAKNNALILENAMKKAGFNPYSMEWWHYNDATDYPVVKSDKYSWVSNLDAARTTTQMIIVAAKKNTAKLSLHTKNEDGVWEEMLVTDAYLGSNGIGKTKEGDKKTPTGKYLFTQAFGRKDNPGVTCMPYTKVDDTYYWVDDSNSIYYNRFVSTNDVVKDWTSAEHISEIAVYDYVLALNYNSSNTPGYGSAIFLHCSSDRNTNGCIAIGSDYMKQILSQLRSDCIIIIDTPDQLIHY